MIRAVSNSNLLIFMLCSSGIISCLTTNTTWRTRPLWCNYWVRDDKHTTKYIMNIFPDRFLTCLGSNTAMECTYIFVPAFNWIFGPIEIDFPSFIANISQVCASIWCTEGIIIIQGWPFSLRNDDLKNIISRPIL